MMSDRNLSHPLVPFSSRTTPSYSRFIDPPKLELIWLVSRDEADSTPQLLSPTVAEAVALTSSMAPSGLRRPICIPTHQWQGTVPPALDGHESFRRPDEWLRAGLNKSEVSHELIKMAAFLPNRRFCCLNQSRHLFSNDFAISLPPLRRCLATVHHCGNIAPAFGK